MRPRSRVRSKKVIIPAIILLLVLAVAGGAFGYRNWQQNKVKQSKVAATQLPETITSQPQETTTKRPGTYEAYDPAKFVLARDGKVVLFFNASWSKTSKQLDKDLRANMTKLPNNLTIMSVDYNKNSVLRKKYEVPFENTFVQVDADGVMVNRWSGSEDVAEIVALAK